MKKDTEITRNVVEEGHLPMGGVLNGVIKLRLSSLYGKFARDHGAPQITDAAAEVMDDLLGALFDEAQREDIVEQVFERALGRR